MEKEFRIGNYVQGSGNICTVESVISILDSENKISKYRIDLLSLDGKEREYNSTPKLIPLTEEWLINLGFVKVLDYPCFRLEGLQIEFNGFDSHWGSGLLDEKTLTKYVHQLQNLFFALKGKELTIKDK